MTSIKKCLTALITATLTLSLVVFPVAAVAAQDSYYSYPQFSSEDPLTQSIWSGLYQGVSVATGSPVVPPPRQVAPMRAPTPPTQISPGTGAKYVAMGDSVAGGLGLPYSQHQCGRSNLAYPTYVAYAKRYSLRSVACSGATAGDLTTPQGGMAPQLDQAYSRGTPAVMTLTIGANNMHWTGFLQSCLVTQCDTAANTALTNVYLAQVRAGLQSAFNEVASRSISSGQRPPLIVLTGYYNPVSSRCATVEPRISTTEVSWITSRIAALNSTLQSSSLQYPFVRYASVSFIGHGLCDQIPWVQGIQDPAPIHPNAAGQNAISRAVLSRM